jgi:hypothetical protein
MALSSQSGGGVGSSVVGTRLLQAVAKRRGANKTRLNTALILIKPITLFKLEKFIENYNSLVYIAQDDLRY